MKFLYSVSIAFAGISLNLDLITKNVLNNLLLKHKFVVH